MTIQLKDKRAVDGLIGLRKTELNSQVVWLQRLQLVDACNTGCNRVLRSETNFMDCSVRIKKSSRCAQIVCNVASSNILVSHSVLNPSMAATTILSFSLILSSNSMCRLKILLISSSLGGGIKPTSSCFT